MSCEVIQLNAERWVCVFDEGGVSVFVSSKGNVRFDTEQKNMLSMKQMMDLAITLSRAFGDQSIE